MDYILGIDGGGTKTIALVADIRGNILGMGLSKGSNYHSVGLEDAIKAIKGASLQAIANSGVSKIKSACFGLAGTGRLDDQKIIFPKLKNLAIADKILLKHDAFIALAGATICQPGVIVIAGTGSMAFGINGSEAEERSGGWGYILGDEGGAYYIGKKALSSACKAFDGRGNDTSLLGAIIKHFAIDDFTQIVKRIYSEKSSPQDIASIAPIVTGQAVLGDKVALEILKESAHELALSARSVIKKLKMADEKVLVATCGSVFDAGELLIAPFRAYIRSSFPFAEIIYPKLKPVTGALLLALQGMGIKPDDENINNLKNFENKKGLRL